MTGSNLYRPARVKARVEIIPLIDVIFFLLATFVLFTLSLNRIHDLAVDLPKAGERQPSPPELVTIQVSGHGSLYWNREPLTLAELPARLAAYTGRTAPERQAVLVSSDSQADFGTAVRVLDDLRAQRITKFSVETRVRDTGR